MYHHTDCGMLTFKDHELRHKLRENVPADKRDAFGPPIDDFAFLPFGHLGKKHTIHSNDSDRSFFTLEQSVKEDVAFLRENPLLAHRNHITGWIYDVKTGKVTQVV